MAKTKERPKSRAKKEHEGNDIIEEEEEEEELIRKAKSRPRSYKKSSAVNASFKTLTTTTEKNSKYFKSSVKERDDDSDDFDMVTSARPKFKLIKAKKTQKTDHVGDDKEEEEDDDSEDEDDWEEVEELEGQVEPSEPALPFQPVEIVIETPEVRRKQKRQAEFESYLRRMMNRFKKDQLISTHKVHLMCLIASGMFRNRLCSEPDLLAITLSLLPSHFAMVPKDRIDQNYLSGLLKWFRATFTLNPSVPCEEFPDPWALMGRRLASLSAKNHQEMTHLFLLVLRSLQLFCRLVLSLQPIPLKAPSVKGKEAKSPASAAIKNTKRTGKDTSKTSRSEPKVSTGTKRPAGEGKNKRDGGGKKAKMDKIKEEDMEEDERVKMSGGQRPKNSQRRSIASKVSYKEESNSEEEKEQERPSDEEFQASSDEDSVDSESGTSSRKKKNGKRKGSNDKCAPAQKKRSGWQKTQKKDQKLEDEDEEEEEGTKQNTTNRRSGNKKEGLGADEWLEVYLEKTSSWVCVDVGNGVGMHHLCSKMATTPVTYVVSVDGDGFLKDLGRKYDPTWMTSSRKRRVDQHWWEETLEPFLGPEDERDKKEEKELQNKLLNKPLPISVGEYKNHPLYALKRHLLKYEAIYPSTATILGYCRGEPVYSRDCVHTLHSRDTWLKEARAVRLGEEPYKMVRGLSNHSRRARKISEQKEENDLALFGEWQTEEYQPPIAVDGKVPRNEYGNVNLFKPCMLPVGCVHLRLPNLQRVARKLDIDAAPAITGFDSHGGYSHAVTDGYIVCEEHEEVLRAAWEEEQELQKQKEKEKREKRVISNWTLLVKGLLIREKLKQRFGKKNQGLADLTHGEEGCGFSSDEEAVKDGSSGAKTAAEILAMSWPQNRQAEEEGGGFSGLKRTTKREKRGQERHVSL
ncbi:DNA repair protein complementing XP-C cells isoform X1 [Xyrichtys novacula]|uniref:DNA repair protein complementing XP-C cells isoform X1 n=1 Tax=Xyrichtys novacula TaxID=13765 RepID=A0AAV1F3C4_XYRNO|nr:DNA repair protein complementing XP-C cells isoform X1 [Xyrichtys novacula]